jgi:hypothetical protein
LSRICSKILLSGDVDRGRRRTNIRSWLLSVGFDQCSSDKQYSRAWLRDLTISEKYKNIFDVWATVLLKFSVARNIEALFIFFRYIYIYIVIFLIPRIKQAITGKKFWKSIEGHRMDIVRTFIGNRTDFGYS